MERMRERKRKVKMNAISKEKKIGFRGREIASVSEKVRERERRSLSFFDFLVVSMIHAKGLRRLRGQMRYLMKSQSAVCVCVWLSSYSYYTCVSVCEWLSVKLRRSRLSPFLSVFLICVCVYVFANFDLSLFLRCEKVCHVILVFNNLWLLKE